MIYILRYCAIIQEIVKLDYERYEININLINVHA